MRTNRDEMSQVNVLKSAEERKLLIERVALSRHVNRSARLRDLLVYLTTRVLEEDALEIHEQEVGHRVFGRPAHYDTGSDNIVRVHASMLRKRLTLRGFIVWDFAARQADFLRDMGEWVGGGRVKYRTPHWCNSVSRSVLQPRSCD